MSKTLVTTAKKKTLVINDKKYEIAIEGVYDCEYGGKYLVRPPTKPKLPITENFKDALPAMMGLSLGSTLIGVSTGLLFGGGVGFFVFSIIYAVISSLFGFLLLPSKDQDNGYFLDMKKYDKCLLTYGFLLQERDKLLFDEPEEA